MKLMRWFSPPSNLSAAGDEPHAPLPSGRQGRAENWAREGNDYESGTTETGSDAALAGGGDDPGRGRSANAKGGRSGTQTADGQVGAGRAGKGLREGQGLHRRVLGNMVSPVPGVDSAPQRNLREVQG